MSFDLKKFELAFNASIVALVTSERVTKKELMELSRTTLEATHATGDIQYINRTLETLTPVNRKVAVAFFTHFVGFSYDDASGRFTTKSKKRYEKAKELALKGLEDPHFNIWTWADRNIEVKPKDFDLKNLTKQVESYIKKAAENNLTKMDVMRAVFEGGLTTAELLGMLEQMDYEVIHNGEPETSK